MVFMERGVSYEYSGKGSGQAIGARFTMTWSPIRVLSVWSQTAKQKRGETKLLRLSRNQTKMWNSRISWRIAAAIFVTIFVVQAVILALTIGQEKDEFLNQLKETGRTVVASALQDVGASPIETAGEGNVVRRSPINEDLAKKLMFSTIVKGLAVYSSDLKLLSTHGLPVSLPTPDTENFQQTGKLDGNKFYEVIYGPLDLRYNYYIAARLDCSSVAQALFDYVIKSVQIMLLLSAFVTVVLMIFLGKWLLEPVLFMRDNLIAASENPENPKIQDSPYNPDNEIGGAIVITQTLIRQNAENILQIKSVAEDKIHKLAYYDTLTGLPNRTLFVQKLSELVRYPKDEDEKVRRFAVITMDLDHFKDINDSMGHNVGDSILRGVGKRLRAALPESAIVARSGEDEFAIMMPLENASDRAVDVADKVSKVVRSEPFKVFNESFQVRSSIGVSTFPDDGSDPDQVLKNADIALNRAKEDGRDRVKEYTQDFDRAVQMRFQLLRDLRDAMEQEDLTLYYQPQFDLITGKIIGAEALLRWFKKDSHHPKGGAFVSPADFVPIAEQSGLIVPIGEWVLRHACRTAADWGKAGHDIRIAVNVSGAQFYQSDLVSHVKRCLEDSGISPENLELEVTESVFMDDVSHTVETLKKLHELGLELAIDDFGTGYSSLAYLRQFPIDRLKIDQSFIRNALNNQDDAAIARTIVSLGHSLNLKVIAEGVETKEHEAFLREEKCDEVQGYRYSRPIPAEEFMKFLKSYNGDFASFDK